MRPPTWRACLAALLLLCTGIAVAAATDRDTTRIVSLVPSVTEFLYAVGAADQVAGTTDFCNYPAEARTKPRVGGLLNPNVEKIISLKPTAVIMMASQGDLVSKLSSLGLHVVQVKTDSLEDVFSTLRTIGQVTGCDVEARHLADSMRKKLDDMRARNVGKPRVRALLIVGRQPASLQNIYAAGSKTYLGELLDVAGGENACPKSGAAYVPLTKEEIIAANPAVIIDTSLGEAGSKAEVVAEHKKAWKQIPMLEAVRAGRVFLPSDPHLTLPGPVLPDTVDTIAQYLHGQAASR